MLSPIDLGSVKIAQPVLLAPMAGVTDLPFRRQAQAFGAPYVVCEMIAGEHLASARRDMIRRVAGAGSVKPLVVQLAGREESWMRLGAELAAAVGADIIDINMGCPAKVVTTGASGSALMREPERAERLIRAAVEASPVPVTVKMRLGWDDQSRNAADIARRAEDAGAALLTVHGRTRCQFYRGAADWAAIRTVVDAVRLPVIANGDILDAASARRALDASGAAGVMIGRGAQGRAWLPAALARALDGGGEIEAPPGGAIFASLLALHRDCLAFYGRDLGLRIARKHIAWTVEANLPGLTAQARRALRIRLCTLEDPEAVQGEIETLAHEPEPMARAA
jgi:nifR3 family TIM-barrel protein